MSEVTLVPAKQAYERTKNGQALLVCAYESDDKFKNVHLEGAIPLSEFQSKVSSIEKDKEIIFYCA